MKTSGPTLFLLSLLPAMALLACGHPPDPVDAAAPNLAIVNSPTPIDTEGAFIQCEGPADELELLGDLCGATYSDTTHYLRDVPWGNRIRVGEFLFYAMGNENDVENLSYAAGFQGEPVTEGRIHTTLASFNTCSTTYEGSAEFLWRNTTIRMNLSGAVPC